MVVRKRIAHALVLALLAAACARTTPRTPRPPIVDLQVDPAEPTVAVGANIKVVVQAVLADGTTEALDTADWSIADAGVAGLTTDNAVAWLAGLKVGATQLTASAKGLSTSVPVKVVGASPVKLAISPAQATVAKAGVASFSAVATLSDQTTAVVTDQAAWTVSDQTVATVGATKGSFTGVKAGQVQVSATYQGLLASATLTVNGAALVRVDVTPSKMLVPVQMSLPLKAVAVFDDLSVSDVTDQASWTSSQTSYATVSSDASPRGVVAGLAPGDTTITATYGGLSGTSAITVTGSQLQAVQVTPPTLQLAKGTSGSFQATALFSGDVPPQDVTQIATWASSDPTIALPSTTAPGTVQAQGTGVAKITATFLGMSGAAQVTVTAAKLTAVSVSPGTLTIPKGATASFDAVGTYSDATTQDVTAQALWSSSNEPVASVSNAPGTQGQALGQSAGAATISASVGGVVGTASLTVTAAQVVSLAMDPSYAVIAKGTTVQLHLTATFTDQSILEVTDQADWSSSDNSVASVTTLGAGRGLVAAAKPGQVTVTAAYAGEQATATIIVTPATLASLSIDPKDPSIAKGTTLQMRATGTYSDGTQQDVTKLVIWSVADSTIAGVSNAAGSQGLVSALAAGTTTLKATLSGQSASTTVTVTPATLVALVIAPTSMTLDYKASQPFTATATYSDGTSVDVTASADWTSADPSIASVTSSGTSRGTVTGNRAGQTTITVSFSGKSATASVTVNAPKLTSLTIKPGALSLAAGLTGSLACWATYADGSQLEVTKLAQWSAAKGLVKVDATGLVTALTVGQDTVTAAYQGLTATATVTVTAPQVDTLTITPTNTTIPQGSKQSYTVRAFFSDGTSQDVTGQALFTTDDTQGLISLAGATATGVKQGGPVTISASYGGLSASAKLTIGPAVTVTTLTISPSYASIAVGQQQPLTVTALFSDGSSQDVTSQAVYTSADYSTVSLSANVAAGVKVGGPVAVTATYGGKSAIAQIAVTAPKATSLSIQPSGAILKKGATVQLAAIVTYSDGSSKDVSNFTTWDSSDFTIASVIAGLVTGNAGGTVTITATYAGLTATAKIQVQAPTLDRIAIVPPNAILRPNLIYPYRAWEIYSDGTTSAVPDDVDYWTSDSVDYAVQPYNYQGYFGVWAMAVGDATLRVNYDNISCKSGDQSCYSTQVQVFDSYITGVQVSPAKLILPLGMAAKLHGVFAYEGLNDGWAVEIENPEWSSHDTSIVSVDVNGVATANKVGTSGIDVVGTDMVSGSFTATAGVQVTSATLQSIALTLPATMVLGLSQRAEAMGTFSDGSVMDLGPSPVFWYTSDNSLATITPDIDGATVTALKAGSVKIGAKLGGVVKEVPVTLVSTTLASLSLNVAQASLPQGSTSLVTVQGNFADGTVQDLTYSATYSSSAPDVAQVVNGLFTNLPWPIVLAQEPNTGVTPTAIITATFAGVSKSATVQVSGANLSSLALAVGSGAPSSTLLLSGGGPFQLRAVGTFSDGSSADVTAMCTFEPATAGTGTVATISNAQAGQVTLLGKGSEQVKVTYAPSYIGQVPVSGSATLTVQ